MNVETLASAVRRVISLCIGVSTRISSCRKEGPCFHIGEFFSSVGVHPRLSKSAGLFSVETCWKIIEKGVL